jgi:hypothetical protein
MFTALIKDNEASHTFVDDLESIFYVILWLVLIYSPSSMDPPDLTTFVQTVLDPAQYEGTGGSCKADFLMGHSALQHLKFDGQPSLQPLLMDLAILFAVRYEPEPSADQKQVLIDFKESLSVLHYLYAWHYNTRLDFLKSHTRVIELLTRHIQTGQWPRNDSANL